MDLHNMKLTGNPIADFVTRSDIFEQDKDLKEQINSMSESDQKSVLSSPLLARFVNYIDNPTDVVKIVAIKATPYLLSSFSVREAEKLIEKISEEDLIEMCKNYNSTLLYIRDKNLKRYIKLITGL